MVTQNVLLGRGTDRLPQKNTIIGSGSERIDADTIYRTRDKTPGVSPQAGWTLQGA